MWTVLPILGLVGALFFAVQWIEGGAVARVEARNLAHAAQVQAKSREDVERLSEEAEVAHAETVEEHQGEIDRLRGEIAVLEALPPPSPLIVEVEVGTELDEFCRPGCKLRRAE